MSTETVFIAFGSNQGNRQDFCDRAIALMKLLPHSQLTGLSSYYETEPVDMEGDQDDMWFYNGVVRIETQLQPEHLLSICKETERGLGREPHDRNCPRTIDLDLLFYGQQVIDISLLTTTVLHVRRARWISDRWPACIAPMVGTNPIDVWRTSYRRRKVRKA